MTSWPFANSTLKVASRRDSDTIPSTSIASFFGILRFFVVDHGLVRTSAPLLVIIMVSSKCADKEPSAVTTVQPSSITAVFQVPRLSIGSIARVMPSRKSGPRPAMPKLGT